MQSSSRQQTPTNAQDLPTLRVVLFAGASRRCDTRLQLQKVAEGEFHLDLRELDLEQHQSHYQGTDVGIVDVALVSTVQHFQGTASLQRRRTTSTSVLTEASSLLWLHSNDQENTQTGNFLFSNVRKLQDEFFYAPSAVWHQAQSLTSKFTDSQGSC